MSKNRERMRELVNYADEVIDSDGYAVIDVKLPDEENLYNPLSTGGNLDLNGDIYDFIALQANIIPSKIPLKIRFHGNVDEDRQAEIKKLMHRHYAMMSYDVTWDFAANFRKTLFLSLFGVCVLLAYFLVSVLAHKELFAEILSIVGTFSLWEAANAVLLDRPALKRTRDAIEQNIDQTVEFVTDEQEGHSFKHERGEQEAQSFDREQCKDEQLACNREQDGQDATVNREE